MKPEMDQEWEKRCLLAEAERDEWRAKAVAAIQEVKMLRVILAGIERIVKGGNQ